LDFRFVHVYSHASVDAKIVAGRIAEVFPRCTVDVRRPFQYDDRIERARISDLKQPFERQPKYADNGMMPLYDGFVLQRILAETIPAKETDHVHILLTDLLTCTFSEDWRYHGRAVVCGTPSIISTTGIVEAPAKPKEFYLAQLSMIDVASLKKRFAGRFIDYGDAKMSDAAAAYGLQALFFFIAGGEPFCKTKSCLLYNAHWQEELLHIIEKKRLCAKHRQMANKFNKRIPIC
jgi:hypothetical protein